MVRQMYPRSPYLETNIDDIEVEDISKQMPMYSFIGKTIEKLLTKGDQIDIKFTDGTYGYIHSTFPFHEISREKYCEYVESGDFIMMGYCSDEPWLSEGDDEGK